MATAPAPPLDILTEIKVDHNNVLDLCTRFHQRDYEDAAGKLAVVNTLVREITVYLGAEEVSVGRWMKTRGMNKEVDVARDVHSRVLTLLATVDILDPASPTYDALVKEAAEATLHHATKEEEAALTALVGKLSDEENTKLTHEYLKARHHVPTTPHPSQPHSGGFTQKAAQTLEKVGDAVVRPFGGHEGKKEFVVVREGHADV